MDTENESKSKAVTLPPCRLQGGWEILTSALDGVNGQRHAPATLYHREMTPVPTVQEAGRASKPVWTQRQEEKSFNAYKILVSNFIAKRLPETSRN
jgi:hypothetical protein